MTYKIITVSTQNLPMSHRNSAIIRFANRPVVCTPPRAGPCPLFRQYLPTDVPTINMD